MVSLPVQAFVNNLIISTQFALIAPSYQPSRILSVGFAALCDTFLELCPDDETKSLTRSSVAYALGMEADTLAAENEALMALAKGKTEAELLASEDFVKLKGTRFRYT